MEITLVDLSALLYIFLGSTSIGYLLIRTGWPSVRVLESQYKVGSSIAAGIAFTIIVGIIFLALALTIPFEYALFHLVFASLMLCFFALFSLMLLKQKFLSKRKVKVSVPKKSPAIKEIPEQIQKRVIPEEQYISVRKDLSQQQLQEIKKALRSVEQEVKEEKKETQAEESENNEEEE